MNNMQPHTYVWCASLFFFILGATNAYQIPISADRLRTPQPSYAAFSNVTVDLGGTWALRNSNGSISINGNVPGSVHTDLLNAKRISDPYFGYNDVLLQWVYWENWTYTKTFTLTSDVTSKKLIVLECDGLDTVADIYLNGKALASTNNMFVKYTFDISSNFLNTGSNTLEIRFTSAPTYAQAQSNASPYFVPTSRYDFDQPGRNFIRKEQCSFGWDWGPMFATQGIWRHIRIVAVPDAFLDEVVVQIFPVSIPPTAFTVNVQAYISAATTVAASVTAAVAGADGSATANLVAGSNTVQLSFVVKSPSLWWPNGYGAQPLYPIVVSLLDSSNSVISQKTKTVGFRSVEIVQDPVDDGGLTFYFRVNGVPIFVKGANWIPADAFEDRVTDDVLEDLLQSAVDANMNLVRNWGGGIYQHDSYYDIADRLGLMVWEEFMFACSMYPRDAAFLDTVVDEITYQIRRLSHHVSIVMWSGNNENEEALGGWYSEVSQNPFLYAVDYAKLYLDTIFPVVQSEDPSRPFWPSSPSNGFIETDPTVIAMWGNPSSFIFGDLHYYNVGDDCTNVSLLPSPRFTSEYGFQAFPSVFAWQQVAPSAADFTFNGSFAQHREHGGGGISGVLLIQMRIHFLLPQNINDPAQFENYIYLSQCMQALCIKSETEHYRRQKSHPANTMGAIYWQLNDIWQGPTWSSIEYGGRWKMLHYYARNFFAPVLVSAYEYPEDVLNVDVTSDLATVLSGQTTVSLWSYDGKLQTAFNVSFNIAPLGSSTIYQNYIPVVLSRYPICVSNKANCFITVSASNSVGEVLSTNVLYLTSLAQVKLPVPTITWTQFRQITSTQISFVISTTQVAPYVFLQTKYSGVFSDNGFLLLPASSKTVVFNSKGGSLGISDLNASLYAKSIANTY